MYWGDRKEAVGFGFVWSVLLVRHAVFFLSLKYLVHMTENSGSWPRLLFKPWQRCTPVQFVWGRGHFLNDGPFIVFQAKCRWNPVQRLEYHTFVNKKIPIHSLVLQMIKWHCFSTGLTWLSVPFPTPAGLQKISSTEPWKHKQRMGRISLLLNDVRDWKAVCHLQKGDNQPSWSPNEQVSVGSNSQNIVCRTIGDKEMVPSVGILPPSPQAWKHNCIMR